MNAPSTQALIDRGLGMNQGFLTSDHAPASGDRVLELKQCENCPASFTRSQCNHSRITRNCGCVKFCGPCRAICLLPLDMEGVKDMLPQHQGASTGLPRYDDSLLPNSLTHLNPRRRQKLASDWKAKLLKAFAEFGWLSSKDIKGIIGSQVVLSSVILTFVRNHGVRVAAVGSSWPRSNHYGQPERMYVLETVQMELGN